MADNTPSELDEKIISLIEQNGRASYREVASSLGISERQAAARLRRLIADDVIRVITVVDAFAAGFGVIVAIGVQVAERPPAEVADAIATLPNVISAALMAGPFDIELMAAVEDHAALLAFVDDDLGAVSGIRSLHVSLLLDVVKYETGAGPVIHHAPALDIPANSVVSEVDRGIIAELWKNASETNENMAAALGVSESTVRKRVSRLRHDNLIHITAMRNVAIGEDVVFAVIGIELDGPERRAVAEALCALRQVHVVAHVLGRYDIIAQVLVGSTAELSDLVNDVIARIRGIRNVSCAQAIRIAKYDYRWRIAGPATRR